jgi:hypothetical protein
MIVVCIVFQKRRAHHRREEEEEEGEGEEEINEYEEVGFPYNLRVRDWKMAIDTIQTLNSLELMLTLSNCFLCIVAVCCRDEICGTYSASNRSF